MSDLFDELRSHIQAKRFAEARRMLLTVDHPKAKAWLAKLDALEAGAGIAAEPAAESLPEPTVDVILHRKPLPEPNRPKRGGSAPWHPFLLAGIASFTTHIGANLALAWNWRRLGKREWTWWTLAAAAALMFTSFAIYTFIEKYVATLDKSTRLALSMFTVLPLTLNVFYPLYIAFIQNGAYKKWQAGDAEGMLNHHYQFGRGLLFCGGLLMVVVMMFGGLTMYLMTPRTYEDSALSLKYPPEWELVDLKTIPDCLMMPAGRRCLVALGQSSAYGYISLIVIQEDLTVTVTLEELDAYFVEQYTASMEVVYDPVQQITLDNHPAVLRTYRFKKPGVTGYEMRITRLDGQTLYQIFATAEYPDTLPQRMDEIAEIYQSIHIKTGGEL